ncbi:MAG: nucleoside monophosphate kinase [Candidatus Sungbacteria bacterium]|nr:nucleoside monophosphate kinase [Candidatus Sungbacteria bacterium]
MEKFSFPIFKTKVSGVTGRFLLEDPVERRKYFDQKAGLEIEKLRDYLSKGNTFVGFIMGPKNSGKGTYTKLFMEAVGGDHVAHISVGDVVRGVHKDLGTEAGKKALMDFLKKRYRGFIDLDKVFDVILGRDTKTHLPTEVILALVEREIDRIGRKAIFIDGFPRNLDQISYSLYFRALIGYRDDPDFFVFIDVPEAVIDERMKYRVSCPVCQSPRNTKLLRTKEVRYDANGKEFYLLCDNPLCSGFGNARMVSKEGDSLGINAIRERLEMEAVVVKKLLTIQGVPKVFLRNSIPVEQAQEYVDDYEITPSYHYELEGETVKVVEEPWTVTGDDGVRSYSLLPVPVALALIKQTVRALDL